MRTRLLFLVAFLATLLAAPLAAPLAGSSALHAQRAEAQAVPDGLTLFLDCREMHCDRDFFITELPYLLLTQDRLDAEIHVLLTRLSTGAGGYSSPSRSSDRVASPGASTRS